MRSINGNWPPTNTHCTPARGTQGQQLRTEKNGELLDPQACNGQGKKFSPSCDLPDHSGPVHCRCGCKCPSCALVSRVTRCKGKQLACALLMLHLEMETPPAGGRVGKNFCACGPHHRGQSGRKKRLPADESAAVRPPPVPRNRRELQIPYGCTLNAISFLAPFGYLCLCMSARYAARHSVSLWVLAFIRLAERVS